MRGTRTAKSRRKKINLIAALLLAATIGVIATIQLSGSSFFAHGGIGEAAAAAPDTPPPQTPPAASQTPEPSASADPSATAKPETKPTPGKDAKPPATSAEPEKNVAVGGDQRKLVALTFDDGPDATYTPEVLDILKARGVKATFFLVGPQVNKYPDTAKRILDEGHGIGNHTWSHKDLSKLSSKQIAEQVDKAQEAIAKATGFTPTLMRAPYGATSGKLLDVLHERDMLHVFWTVDTRDWAGTSVADMRKNVLAHTKPGGIILMHSFGGRKNALENTVKLLPLIIDDLSKKGFEFVTVDEMIEAGAAHKSVVK